MKISFAILCYDEAQSLHEILSLLLVERPYEYEIIIVQDGNHQPTTEMLKGYYEQCNLVNGYRRDLNNDFSAQKNYMTEKCSGDWVFNLDSDELPPEYLLENIHLIIEQNDAEVLWLPRINIINGLTQEWAKRLQINVNELGWVNYPDFQQRIYKNDYPRIHWERPVHERIVGFKTHAFLPTDIDKAEHLAMKHVKTIQNQVEQNQKYAKIMGVI